MKALLGTYGGWELVNIGYDEPEDQAIMSQN